MATMTDAAWQAALTLAARDCLGDAQLAGLAIGCPAHGNASMDWDGTGASADVFCHECTRAAPQLCRACLLWEWDGTGELPYNPDAGPCAHCGGQHGELYSGCCAACYRAGYREACSRVHS